MTIEKKRRQRRQYTIADLQGIVDQLGGRLSLSIMPAELCAAGGALVDQCDYCDKQQKDVKVFIRAPNGRMHICDICVGRCVQLIAEQPPSVEAVGQRSERIEGGGENV